jgi:hypothetical protein
MLVKLVPLEDVCHAHRMNCGGVPLNDNVALTQPPDAVGVGGIAGAAVWVNEMEVLAPQHPAEL